MKIYTDKKTAIPEVRKIFRELKVIPFLDPSETTRMENLGGLLCHKDPEYMWFVNDLTDTQIESLKKHKFVTEVDKEDQPPRPARRCF